MNLDIKLKKNINLVTYSIEELIGTDNGKIRYLQFDLLNRIEYKQVLNTGVICIEGLCLHVYEYLTDMFCSTCNLLGHHKKRYQYSFEGCKSCGADRNVREHEEREIICHNCKGNHLSAEFSCSVIRSYRHEVIKYIRLYREILFNHVQIFIPSYCPQNGIKVVGN